MGKNVTHSFTHVKPQLTKGAGKMLSMGIEEKLKNWMGTKWTPTTLAKRVGVSRQTVHNWLDGSSKPKGKHLDTLCRLMGTDPASLLYGESPKQIDTALLETALEVVEAKLTELGVSLPPSKKAALVAALFRAASKSGAMPDPSIVSEMIKLSS